MLHEVYGEEGIPLPTNDDVATFAQMTIPKSAIDARVIFPVVDRIPNALLILVSPKNKLLISYKSSMNPTPIGILHKKVSFEATKGSSKVVKDKKTKKQTKKPKVVKVEVSYQTVPVFRKGGS